METDQNAGDPAAEPDQEDKRPPDTQTVLRRRRDISGRQGSPTGEDDFAGPNQQTGHARPPGGGQTVKKAGPSSAKHASPPGKNLAD